MLVAFSWLYRDRMINQAWVIVAKTRPKYKALKLPSLSLYSKNRCWKTPFWETICGKCAQALRRLSFMQASALCRRKPCAGSAFLQSMHAHIFSITIFRSGRLDQVGHSFMCHSAWAKTYGSWPRTPIVQKNATTIVVLQKLFCGTVILLYYQHSSHTGGAASCGSSRLCGAAASCGGAASCGCCHDGSPTHSIRNSCFRDLPASLLPFKF